MTRRRLRAATALVVGLTWALAVPGRAQEPAGPPAGAEEQWTWAAVFSVSMGFDF